MDGILGWHDMMACYMGFLSVGGGGMRVEDGSDGTYLTNKVTYLIL